MGRERSPGSGPGGRRHTATSRCRQESASPGGISLDIEKTGGSPIYDGNILPASAAWRLLPIIWTVVADSGGVQLTGSEFPAVLVVAPSNRGIAEIIG
jgi:hypothetical protein